MSCPVTVKLNVLSFILCPSGDVALIANDDVTFSLTSVGVPLTLA